MRLALLPLLLAGCATTPTEGTYEVGYNMGYYAGVADEARRQEKIKAPSPQEQARINWEAQSGEKIIDGRIKR